MHYLPCRAGVKYRRHMPGVAQYISKFSSWIIRAKTMLAVVAPGTWIALEMRWSSRVRRAPHPKFIPNLVERRTCVCDRSPAQVLVDCQVCI